MTVGQEIVEVGGFPLEPFLEYGDKSDAFLKLIAVDQGVGKVSARGEIQGVQFGAESAIPDGFFTLA